MKNSNSLVRWKTIQTVLFWVFLNLLVVLCMDLAFFMQTTFSSENATLFNKLLTTEFWATMEWLVLIPAQRIGNTFLNPAQLNLSSFVFNFIGQYFTNNYWLKIPTTLDDYAGMAIILFAMYLSKMRLIG
jgi:uncharacterized protein (DUF486 family)